MQLLVDEILTMDTIYTQAEDKANPLWYVMQYGTLTMESFGENNCL